MKKEVIFIICAHSDDEAIGMGGTIFKYLEEKKQLVKIIFSFGEQSHPHIKEEHTKKTRVKETTRIEKRLGIKTYFLGVKDFKIKDEIHNSKLKENLSNLIKKYKPQKIFMTSLNDIHTDHRAVANITLDTCRKIKYPGEIYTYEVWAPKKENNPYIYVDVSKYQKKKIELIKEFVSQKIYTYPLLFLYFLRSRSYGKKIQSKYAERFYRIQ
ncbi:MAG: PIG-L family deacetylase [Candidatus Nanoarchaeia archaeon]|nr:PIG-L family deacetylase [Candidatus Nanoarchaeia archaeon]